MKFENYDPWRDDACIQAYLEANATDFGEWALQWWEDLQEVEPEEGDDR